MENVAIVGFYGSGSSAVIDLLREFEKVGVALDRNEKGVLRPYEHFPFVSSGGLFECCTLLENVNSVYGSDKIINNFVNCNKRLNDNNFMSFGSYKWLVGDKFMQATRNFLKSIGAKETNGGTSEHKVKIKFSLIMCALQLAALIVYKRPVYKWGKKNIYDKQPTYFAMPSEEKVYSAAKEFVNEYFEMCRQKDVEVMVYDQLICPQHTSILDKFFDGNLKVIAVERDVRDIYSLSKHFWSKPPYGFAPPLPVDFDEFAEYWRGNLDYERNKENVLVVQFEDLVYNYEETKGKIMEYLGLEESAHIRKFEYFDPKKSIKNTQSFYMNEQTKSESDNIAELLPEFVYEFPYKIETDYSMMFDDTKEANEKEKNK